LQQSARVGSQTSRGQFGVAVSRKQQPGASLLLDQGDSLGVNGNESSNLVK